MPALEALQGRFEAANTQVLGVSIDSVYSHANWAASLGGISFPLLADFHPKGAVAKSFGAYLEDKGITDRATVIIDAGGTVRYATSVTPAGQRDMAALAAECEAVNKAYEGDLAITAAAPGIAGDGTLFVKSNCGFSRAVLLAVDNLHLHSKLTMKNVSEDESAMADLETRTGKTQAPMLLSDGKPMFESNQIIDYLVTKTMTL